MFKRGVLCIVLPGRFRFTSKVIKLQLVGLHVEVVLVAWLVPGFPLRVQFGSLGWRNRVTWNVFMPCFSLAKTIFNLTNTTGFAHL
jgi:hypothetical protein